MRYICIEGEKVRHLERAVVSRTLELELDRYAAMLHYGRNQRGELELQSSFPVML